MLAAFIIASIGRARKDVALLIRDWLVLVVVYMLYDYSRGSADNFGIGVNFTLLRDIDRFLFFGHDAGAWLQTRLRRYDVSGSIIYMMHFVLPVVPLATLRMRDRQEWLRYVRRFSITLYLGVLAFIAFPAAPPWMAAEKGYIDPLPRITGRGWWELNLKVVSQTFDRGAAVLNAVAAMPSLHCALSLLVAMWFARNSPRWVRIGALAYPLSMAFTLVYFGEHWFIDCVMGWAIVLIAWRISNKWETRRSSTATSSQLSN